MPQYRCPSTTIYYSHRILRSVQHCADGFVIDSPKRVHLSINRLVISLFCIPYIAAKTVVTINVVQSF
ncbi:hypothetical protein NEOLEDRAFT_1136334 [Neolentinus lepideus HHB14362 ss-1]|uniref:Uncharacterized protein n=1 Tax=Neolentinus lepideus HHB14362 ss-1 TaxID=1314782 RepID=A0A165RAY0_9AGAM|nr:hypothetical protein NEOLEDRAFT_1136334 [Neolentinus lepideus HHB14362 ss-1]